MAKGSARRLTSRSAERRGRGPRGAIFPPGAPALRTQAQRFDHLVLEAFAPIDDRFHDRLIELDLAVDDVPKVAGIDLDTVIWPPEVVADGPVPLARLIPAGLDQRGRPTRARMVLFRRPLQQRALDTLDLLALLHEVLVQQVAAYLGLDPDELDPGDGLV
jgi:predicted Zn-dependent protease with MMP-like domain